MRAAGQDLEGAYAKADKLDDALLERLPIAFDERLGFLTAVPTNLGTGMQAMLDLHLPALAGQGLIDQLTVMIGKLGLSLQPLYDGHGSFYRLTNQVTLGITEKAAIDNVNAICDQIVRQERNLRQQLQQQDAFLDRIYRAMGTLQMARTLNQDEFFDLVSLLRLGISLGESSKTYSDVGELIQKVQNATIAAAAGAEVEQPRAARQVGNQRFYQQFGVRARNQAVRRDEVFFLIKMPFAEDVLERLVSCAPRNRIIEPPVRVRNVAEGQVGGSDAAQLR